MAGSTRSSRNHDRPPGLPAHQIEVLCSAIGNYLRRVDAWLFEQSYTLSQLQLAHPRTNPDLDVPFVYPRMQEFQARRDTLKETIQELHGPGAIPYPERFVYVLSLPALGTWHTRAHVVVRGLRDTLSEHHYRVFHANLRSVQHLTLEVYDVALYQRNSQRRGRRSRPITRENHGIPTA